MKLLYKPFGIIAAAIGARLGKNVFVAIWARFDDAAPPDPKAPNAPLLKVVSARALEAATMAGVGAAVDRVSAKAFHHLTGAWPGENPEPKE